MAGIYRAILPIGIGFVLDCILGDPHSLPHPVRWIGSWIAWLEERLYAGEDIAKPAVQKKRGCILAVLGVLVSTGLPALVLALLYAVCWQLGIVAEGILCYYLLAARSLRDESMRVYAALPSLDAARAALSMIVGRDTDRLDEEGIVKAAVETVAENTADGVTAPLFYMTFGGAVLGFFYKAVNTMDSMIGYQNDRYRYFGTCAAKWDDVLNFLPSRCTAWLMIAAAYLMGMDGTRAYQIWKRDRRNHASPNSAQTESVCAGALQVQLAGDAYYFGILHKKAVIGDAIRRIEPEDIKRANRLMYVTTIGMVLLSLLLRGGLYAWFFLP